VYVEVEVYDFTHS